MNRRERADTVCAGTQRTKSKRASERGFTLVETTIALIIMMVAGLGAASLFAYAINDNSAGGARAQAIALAQQRLEQLRNATFTSSSTDTSLNATTGTSVNATGADGSPYTIRTTITDNAAGTPVGAPAGVLKTIKIEVTPNSAGAQWATNTAISRVTVWTQRARSN